MDTSFFSQLKTKYPELAETAKDFNVTIENVLALYANSVHSGNIETGFAAWVGQSLKMKYTNDPTTDEINSKFSRYITELTMVSEGISCYPIEESMAVLTDRIRVIVRHLVNMHNWLIK